MRWTMAADDSNCPIAPKPASQGLMRGEMGAEPTARSVATGYVRTLLDAVRDSQHGLRPASGSDVLAEAV
jgi:hypothetical protein